MEANAITLLQQLTSSPQMVSQLQQVLSMLSAQAEGTAAPPADAPSRVARQTTSPVASLQEASRSGQRAESAHARASGSRVKPSGRLYPRAEHVSEDDALRYVSPVLHDAPQESYEQLRQRLRAAEGKCAAHERAAAAAAAHQEEITRRLHQADERVEQLSALTQDQRRRLALMAESHQLELAELRHTHEVALQRKDEVHTAAMKELLRSRQLLDTALRYEERAQAGARAGLAAATTPLNVPHRGKQSGSIVKRDPHTEEVIDTAKPVGLSSRRPADSADSLKRMRHEVSAASPKYGGSGVTPTGSSTQRRSRVKRRTPRTPSLTNADRLTLSRSPPPPPLSAGHPAARPLPYGTGSVQLDSPQSYVPPLAGTQPQPSWPLEGISREVPLRSETTSPAPATAAVSARPLQYRPRPAAPPAAAELSPSPGTRFVKQYATAAPHSLVPRRAGGAPAAERPRDTRSGTSSVVPGPTRSPSPVNPKRGPALPRRFIFTGLREGEPEYLRRVIAALGQDGCTLTSDSDEPPPPHTTHIVVRGTPRSVKAMCGVVSGKWLVAPEYLEDSMNAGFWLDEMEEGGLRIFPPPLKCQRFLLTVEHDGIREKLSQVIEYGGGEVVKSSSASITGRQQVEQGVVVITCGDDLLQYATQRLQ